MFLPATVLVNVNNGTSVELVLNLYCSDGIPCIEADPSLRPNSVLSAIAEFNTNINCSAQFEFVGSFHLTVCCARFLPLLSTMLSVVDTLLNFSSPLLPILRLALYESILAILRTLSLRSA